MALPALASGRGGGEAEPILTGQAMTASNDPLFQPYQLKHLRLKNRVMSTSHEPAYSDDGMPKERYRHYHAEKA
jgi:hypothetical protein